jgi:enoyl-[acyl-carrier protein] reductase II
LKTKITSLFGIEHPIICAGMGYVAVPELVAAVSNAGGMGILATATLTPEETLASVKKIRELTDKPFGANVTLIYETAYDNARVLIEEQVPVVNMSMGIADWIIEGVHAYDGKIISTVVTERHAHRAAKEGADVLIATGHEAAGHGGDASSLVIIPLIVNATPLPVIAAGGFGNGRGLSAALMLGAEAISMGTRFATSTESHVHARTKDHYLRSSVLDTIYTEATDGWGNRYIKTDRLKMVAAKLSLFQSLLCIPKIKKALHLTWPEVIIAGLKGGIDIRKSLSQAQIVGDTYSGLTQGDFESGTVPGGQIVGAINQILPVELIINSTIAEAEELLKSRGEQCGLI